MSIHRRADAIRLVAVRLGQGELKDITQRPGVHEALRVSVYYHDGRFPNSVATLTRGLSKPCHLQVAYDKTPKPVYFDLTVSIEKFHALLLDLRRARFDKLDDQPDVPFYGVDLWLVERIAGSFYHDIVLSPNSSGGNYREIMRAIQTHIPDSVRQGVH